MRRMGLVPALLLLAFGGATPPSVANGNSAADSPFQSRSEAVAERQSYGLPVDDATMNALESGADVGTQLWGIPLTQREESELDLLGRMTFADEVNRTVIPALEQGQSYAGAWFDQRQDGRLVVMLTDAPTASTTWLEDLMPEDSRGLRIVEASRTIRELEASVEQLEADWRELETGLDPTGAGIDVMNNGLFLYFHGIDLDEAEEFRPKLASAIGTPVALLEQSGTDTCTDRDWCDSPLQIGNMIRRGNVTSTWYCTMGFHITIGGDHQFLTAGHCGYFTPNTWYHKGLQPLNAGLVGGELATLYGNGGKDIMRVQMANSQASELVYGVTLPQQTNPNWGDAQPGETLCRSGAKSDNIDCGTLGTRWASWTSDTPTPHITVWGGVMNNVIQIDGDSGAPLYRQVWNPPGYVVNTAIGIMDHEDGGFAWVKHAIEAWGGSLYSP